MSLRTAVTGWAAVTAAKGTSAGEKEPGAAAGPAMPTGARLTAGPGRRSSSGDVSEAVFRPATRSARDSAGEARKPAMDACHAAGRGDMVTCAALAARTAPGVNPARAGDAQRRVVAATTAIVKCLMPSG